MLYEHLACRWWFIVKKAKINWIYVKHFWIPAGVRKCRILRAEGVLQVVLFKVLWFKWSVQKHCVATALLAIWEIFLPENDRTYNSYRFSYKFPFILFLSFLTNQKQESYFQQVGGLVTRNISIFVYSELRSTSKPCQIQ